MLFNQPRESLARKPRRSGLGQPSLVQSGLQRRPQLDCVVSGKPRIRLEMMLFWISNEPP